MLFYENSQTVFRQVVFQLFLQKTYNVLSFVSINEKGGDCWPIVIDVMDVVGLDMYVCDSVWNFASTCDVSLLCNVCMNLPHAALRSGIFFLPEDFSGSDPIRM